MLGSRDEVLDFFYAPADWDISPDSAAADVHTQHWAQEMGLVRSPAAAQRLESWHIATSAGCAFPRARGEALNWIGNWITQAFVFDDTFTSISGDVPRVAAIIDHALRILDSDLDSPPPLPLWGATRALRDLLHRASTRMSEQWMWRFRHNMANVFRGHLSTHMAAAKARPLDVPTIMIFRRDDIGLKPPIDMIDLFEGFELPTIVSSTPSFRRARILLCELIVIQNDVCSLQRDSVHSTDGVTNIVFALERQHGSGLEHAVMQARQMYRDRLTEMSSAQKTFRTECMDLGLTGDFLANAELYMNDLCGLVHGTLYAHITVAARGYLDETNTVPEVSEVLDDYDDCDLGSFRHVSDWATSSASPVDRRSG